MKRYQLAASIICANFLNLEKDLEELDKGKIDLIHFDVMDGVFVPRLGLPPEIIRVIKSKVSIPVRVHIMMDNPEPFIDKFIEAGADELVFHIEPLQHVHRLLKSVRSKNVRGGVALNPATPLSVLDYILDEIDTITLMAINPGILGHPLIPSVYKKLQNLKKILKKYPKITIEVDGGVSFESGPKMIKSGANILVCGTSSIFKVDEKIDDKLKQFRKILDSKK